MPSIATSPHRKPVVPPTRKRKARILSNAERQARFRAKRDARLRELEERAVLRNEPTPLKVVSLRNVTKEAENVDDTLTRLRQGGDRLVAAYVQLAPSLSKAQLATIVSRFGEWRKHVKAAER
jgi:hypothetical protein